MKVVVGRNPMNLEADLPSFKKNFPSVDFVHCTNEPDLMQAICDADVFVGWPPPKVLAAAKNLKWVQVPGTGVDGILYPEMVASDVVVTSIRGAHGTAIAESALCMIFVFTRGILASILAQPQHRWIKNETRGKMIELPGSTLGIVGFGSIGRALAERARPFGPRILAVDIYPPQKPASVDEMWGLDRLDDLLQQSDYVVVAVPGTPETKHMIGAAQIARMKPSAMLIGVSRGGVIDEKAVATALREQRLAAAALDVFEQEPVPPDSELWDVPNLLLTPHIAGGTQYEGVHMVEIFTENLHRFIKGEMPLRNQVDKVKGF